MHLPIVVSSRTFWVTCVLIVSLVLYTVRQTTVPTALFIVSLRSSVRALASQQQSSETWKRSVNSAKPALGTTNSTEPAPVTATSTEPAPVTANSTEPAPVTANSTEPAAIEHVEIPPIRWEPVETIEYRYGVSLLLEPEKTFQPFQYLVEPVACTETKFAKSIAHVASILGEVSVRKRLREIWTTDAAKHGMQVIFVIGRAKTNGSNSTEDVRSAILENQKYGDILMINAEDTLKNLNVKLWSSLDYHVHHCSHIPFVFPHVDRDTVVFVEHFQEYIARNAQNFTDSLGCLVMGGGPVRDPKHPFYVPVEQWPVGFKLYCSGILMLASTLSAKKLLDAIPKLGIDYYTSFRIFDVPTGLLAQVAGVTIKALPGLVEFYSSKIPCDNGTLGFHGVKNLDDFQSFAEFERKCCVNGSVNCTLESLPDNQKWILK